MFPKNLQFYKFCFYGFLKNIRLFDPFLLIYLSETGLTFFEIGILYSIREISVVIFEIPTGIYADITSRKKSLIFSFLFYIFSFLIFFFSPEFWFLVLAMIFYSVGDAFRTGTHKAIILDYLEMNNLLDFKAEFYGHTRSWSQKGSAISSLLAGALILLNNGDYKIIFIVSVIPYLLNMINVYTYPDKLDGIKVNKNEGIKNFFSFFRNKDFRIRIVNSGLFDGLFKSLKDYLQPILNTFVVSLPILSYKSEQFKTTLIISITYFIIYNINSIASKNAGRVKNKLKSLSKAINITYLMGVILMAIGGYLFEINISILTILFFVLIFAMQNIRRPLNVSCVSEVIPKKQLATGLSIESQTRTIFTAILSPIIGLLADIWGIGFSIATISLVLLLLYPLIKIKE